MLNIRQCRFNFSIFCDNYLCVYIHVYFHKLGTCLVILYNCWTKTRKELFCVLCVENRLFVGREQT